jgi:hypothetical protein
MLWLIWTLSVLFLVTWVYLWFRTRRARMWFAVLAPTGAFVGVIVGVFWSLTAASDSSCFGRNCRGDVGNFTESLDANAGFGGFLLANSILAFAVGMTLAVISLVVEVALMILRHRAAKRNGSPA